MSTMLLFLCRPDCVLFCRQEVMRDPVLCEAAGQTYERAAITAWLREHATSYVSGVPVQTPELDTQPHAAQHHPGCGL